MYRHAARSAGPQVLGKFPEVRRMALAKPGVRAAGRAVPGGRGRYPAGHRAGRPARPEAILARPKVGALIDFTQPVAVPLIAIVHFLTSQDDPARIITTLRDALPPGSYLALSHGTADFHRADGPGPGSGAAPVARPPDSFAHNARWSPSRGQSARQAVQSRDDGLPAEILDCSPSVRACAEAGRPAPRAHHARVLGRSSMK